MRSPTLAELPPPPPGKIGWPWTEEVTPLPALRPDGEPWPKMSIVTPSWNQGPFIEETLRSVLLQGYPDLEYIVIDGGSTDETVALLRKYEPWLVYWVSERDQGQTDAINKGFARVTGELLGWLNSDDVYEPGALAYVGTYFAATPACELLYGNGWHVDESGAKLDRIRWIRPYDRRRFLTLNFILQPAAFWRRSLWERAGNLDTTLNWTMDWEWLIRATGLTHPHYRPVDLARWRIRPEIKTLTGGWPRRAEIAAVCLRYGGPRQPTYLAYQLDRAAWSMASRLGHGTASQLAYYVLDAVPWVLKMTLWRRRHLS